MYSKDGISGFQCDSEYYLEILIHEKKVEDSKLKVETAVASST